MVHWDCETEGYPPAVLEGLWWALARLTLEWIDAEQPRAWYRRVFAGIVGR